MGDASALAEEILRMLKSETLRRELGEAGRAHVAQKFSVETMVGQLKALYRELFRERGWRIPGSWDAGNLS